MAREATESDGSAPRQQVYEAKPGAACAALPSGYRRGDPEATVLHEVVREYLSTFLLECAHEGGLPRFVEKDFTAYLECGVLAHGFSRVVCSDCKDEFLVAPTVFEAGIGFSRMLAEGGLTKCRAAIVAATRLTLVRSAPLELWALAHRTHRTHRTIIRGFDSGRPEPTRPAIHP